MDLLRSERVLDKLKLLNYEKHFLPKYRTVGIRSIPRHYFATDKVKSSTSQFYTFVCVCTWLIQLNNVPIDIPDENDDPLEILDNILAEAQALGVKKLNFPAVNLVNGYGQHALFLLESLTELALAIKNFSWQDPIYPDEDEEEKLSDKESENDTDNESIVDIVEKSRLDKIKLRKEQSLMIPNNAIFHDSDLDEDYSDNEDAGLMDLDNVLTQNKSKKAQNDNSKLDWENEVEKVAPNLKVVARLESKDWRARFDQIESHQNVIDNALVSTKPKLDRLEKELGRCLDTVGSRQKYLNSQLEPLLVKLRNAQDNLLSKEEEYDSVSGGLQEKTLTFNNLSSRLEIVKKSMEERGTSMTDGAPLVKLKNSLNRLHNEILEMTLQNAVLEHQLTQMKMHKKSTLARDVNLNVTSVMG